MRCNLINPSPTLFSRKEWGTQTVRSINSNTKAHGVHPVGFFFVYILTSYFDSLRILAANATASLGVVALCNNPFL